MLRRAHGDFAGALTDLNRALLEGAEMRNAAPDAPCPCHSGVVYGVCCGPFHDGEAPPTPTALMRSRYAAYALGLVDYVIDTTQTDGPRARADRTVRSAEILEFGRCTSFTGLEILASGERGDTGWVHFRAILVQGGRDASFEERSGFTRIGGRWLYSSGTREPSAR